MAHALILGMTESGKTTLAKQLAQQFKSRGIGVIVLDPLADPEWQSDFKTSDPAEFLKVLWASRRCAVFIDESGDAVGRYNDAMVRTATRGRHWGHSLHFITQRGVQISATVRDQCSHLFLFCSSFNDSKIHADEWNQPQLRTASQLKKGEFFHVTRFGEFSKQRLF